MTLSNAKCWWMSAILSCLLPVFSFAQPLPDTNVFELFQQVENIDTTSGKIHFLCRKGDLIENVGTRRQFLQEDWVPGVLMDFKHNLFPVSLRYRLSDDEMLIRLGEDVCILQRPTIQALQMEDRVFVSLVYANERDEATHGYFELLTEGRIRLLRKLELKHGKVKECLFLQVDAGSVIPYNGRKKELLQHMNDQLQHMKSFLSNNSYKWKDVEDLTIIINQYHRFREGN